MHPTISFDGQFYLVEMKSTDWIFCWHKQISSVNSSIIFPNCVELTVHDGSKFPFPWNNFYVVKIWYHKWCYEFWTIENIFKNISKKYFWSMKMCSGMSPVGITRKWFNFPFKIFNCVFGYWRKYHSQHYINILYWADFKLLNHRNNYLSGSSRTFSIKLETNCLAWSYMWFSLW